MDSRFDAYRNSFRAFGSNDETVVFLSPHQLSHFSSGHSLRDGPLGLDLDRDHSSFMDLPPFATPPLDDHGEVSPDPPPSISTTPEAGFPDNDGDNFDETVYRYIGHMLMEEEMGEKECMFHDPLALQAAEKSFYDVLSGEDGAQPSSSYHLGSGQTHNGSSRNDNYRSSANSGSCSLESAPGQIAEHEKVGFDPYLSQFQVPSVLSYNCGREYVVAAGAAPQMPIVSQQSQLPCYVSELGCSSPTPGEWESFSSSRPGLEQARSSRLVPCVNGFFIGSEKHEVPPGYGGCHPEGLNSEEYWTSARRGGTGKNRTREDEVGLEERSGKQLAVCVEEDGLSEMFDRVLLCPGHKNSDEGNATISTMQSQTGTTGFLGQDLLPFKFHVGFTGANIQEQVSSSGVDLKNLLLVCARAISSGDRRTAEDLLRQIRQHSSPFGDGYQRFAHYCANALMARVDGTGPKFYSFWVKKKSAVDVLKAYQLFLSTCPFIRFAMFFANHHILSLSEKAKTLHIVDFGILYGFQWPILIQRLADRAGGPPKLRITGIELPQPGFRPEEKVKETGRRLAMYCERFKVPFEFNAIAQKWESIRVEDLSIRKGETVVVNCLNRFKNLLDESVVVKCPRAAVLNFVREINPDIFVHSVVNGSYSAPFFVTRFREACFHFAALYDMFDATIPRENPDRLMFEREFYGWDAMNVIACEGSERIERPETYKQWQVRNSKAGFRQIPLSKELVKKVKSMVKAGYHKDFVVDQDGHWLLLGWRGRIFNASSCWVPAELS